MRFRRGLLAVIWLCAAASLLAARAPQDVPLKETLNADDVRKVGERLRALQSPADPELLEALAKLVQANPGMKPAELAMKLRQLKPELARPENAAKLSKLLDSVNPKAGLPPTVPPTVPPTTTPAVEPTPPPMLPGTSPDQQPAPMTTPIPPTPLPGGPVGTPAPEANSTPQVPPVNANIEGNLPQPPGTPQNPPAGVPQQPPATSDQEAQFRAAAGWWEKNVGPIDDSPAIKAMLAEFIKGAGTGDGKSPLASLLKDLKGDASTGFKDWAKDNLPKDFKFPDLGLGGPKGLPTLPKLPTAAPARPALDFGDLGSSWAPVALLVLVAAGAFAVFVARPWWTGRMGNATPTPVPGLGPWPLDPRTVTSRDALVRAFDYLSVLTLGAEARQYNHVTIAGELRRRVPAADDVADELGRHYALARYTPPGDPIPEADIAAARAALCRLAGVPA